MTTHVDSEYTSPYYMPFRGSERQLLCLQGRRQTGRMHRLPYKPVPSKMQDVFMELGLSLSVWRKRLKVEDPWKEA